MNAINIIYTGEKMKLKLTVFTVLAVLIFAACGGGVKEKRELKTEEEKVSYFLGLNTGGSFKQQFTDVGVKIDVEAFLAGLNDGMSQKDTLLTEKEIRELLEKFQKDLMAKHEKKRMDDGKKNKETSDKFLAENAKKDGVKITASGLQYKVIESGSGKTPTINDKVKAHYTGKTLDGKVFDSSMNRGEPVVFPVNGVIKGWIEALQLMKEGDKWELYIPAELAYGEQGAGAQIGPNQALIFELSLISIEK